MQTNETVIDFIASGLDPEPFELLFALDEYELAYQNVKLIAVDEPSGFPCRVSLVDAAVGDTVALLPFNHHEVDSPYRASGPIFVRKSAQKAELAVNEVPSVMANRLLSFRSYDRTGFMVDCTVSPGFETVETVQTLFGSDQVAYIHVHNARPGCYSCRIDRA